MSDTKTDGPKVRLDVSCFECTHERSEGYQVQGDSGFVVRCGHPSLDAPKRIGDTTWETPPWCPMLKGAIAAAIDALIAEASNG